MFNYFPYMFLSFVPIILLVLIIVGVVVFINNRSRNLNNMDPNQMKPKASAKDILLNLGAFLSLYILIGNLLSLLFTIINRAYPKITNSYGYYGTSSISWPVSALIVLLPIFIILMYFLEREYRTEPDRQNSPIHRGLAYLTLSVSGLVIVGNLVTIVFFFVDGQELTTGFLLKVLVLLVIFASLFIYFISDLRGKLTSRARIFWRILAGVLVLGSIIWGFSVIGSPRTQQLFKYDQQKVSDLQSLRSEIEVYFSTNNALPNSLEDLASSRHSSLKKDSQTQRPYEYVKTSETTYSLCAEFNKASDDRRDAKNYYSSRYLYDRGAAWTHPAGRHCFDQTINPNIYSKPVPN